MPCAATWPNGASATRPETTVTPASTSTPNPSTSTSSPANATGRGGGMVIGGGSTGTLTRARLPSGAPSVDVGPRAHRWRTRQPNLERSRRANTEFDVGCRTMRALLIVNPHATSTNERRRDLLAHTESRGHAAHLAAAAADSGVDLIVVHGGDGTVNEVVNGLMYRGVRPDSPLLAVVPGGSTNVFARALTFV